MIAVNMHEAKTHLSKLVEALVSGRETEITISRNGKPAVRMTALEPEPKPRQFGFAKGRFTLVDDFDRDDALIQRMFEEGADPFGEKLVERAARHARRALVVARQHEAVAAWA